MKPGRVKDAVFSMKGKLLEMKELDYHSRAAQGKSTGPLAIIEATRSWMREPLINEAQDEVELSAMPPIVQLGGI